MIPFKSILGSVALLMLGTASAQERDPGSTDPAAASSPHQRQATGENVPEQGVSSSPEASAASSPHQQEVTGEGDSQAGKGMDAAEFVKKAALGGIAEVELARLALSKTADASVRAFANRMIQDHATANEALLAIADHNQIKAPRALDATHKAMVEKLGFENGKDFDAAYAKQMMEDHHETIALFESATRSGNADISAFARKTLPTLRQHAAMAMKLPGNS